MITPVGIHTPASTSATEETNQSSVQTTRASNDVISSTTTAQPTTAFKTSPLVASVTERTSTTELPVTNNTMDIISTTMMTESSDVDTTSERSSAATTAAVTTPAAVTTTVAVSTTTTTLRPTSASTSSATTTLRPTSAPISSTTTTTTIQTTTKRTSTSRSTTPFTTQPSTPDTPRPTMVDWANALEEFQGCYIPGTGGSIRDTVLNARRVYQASRTTCPEVQIGNILWSSAEAGETSRSSCTKAKGFATFHCGAERICWTGQPDVTGCASQKLQILLKKVDVPDSEITAPTVEESIKLSSQLAQATETEETTMEDVLVTSQVITALTHVTEGSPIKNKEQVQAIVDNVVKAGSNLVSSNKSAMWEEMSQDDKVRSASSLLIAMETATVSMAQEINEPTVITQKNENIELELRVVDISAQEKEKKTEIVYDSSQSESSFSIPIETLQSVSKGGLAKAVFMTHYSMSDILGGRYRKHSTRPSAKPRDDFSVSGVTGNQTENRAENKPAADDLDKDEVEEETGPRIASYILSASLGVDGPITKLPKPISFTMKHVEEIEEKYTPLCSFWDVSQNMHQGFWSQEGCRLVRTNRSHTTCECDHLTNFAILLDVHGFEATKTSDVHQYMLRLVTVIGCDISCVSLLASWITFQCFTSLQGERNSIHKNLAMTLLLAEILFVTGVHRAEYQILCSVIAGFLHYLFLAAFMWMFIEGLHIIFMLVQVFDSSRSRLPYYYLTGYGAPLVIVGASCLFFYRGYGTDKFCWLTTERYFVWAFAGPVALILLIHTNELKDAAFITLLSLVFVLYWDDRHILFRLVKVIPALFFFMVTSFIWCNFATQVNAIFLTYAMSTVCRHSEYVFSGKDKDTGSGIRVWVQGALALEVLLGLTWTFGYFLISESSLPLAYVFSILNSLQGLFIFFFHCVLNKKVQKEYRQVARSVVRRTQSSSSSNTHSTLTKRTHQSNHSHDNNHSPSNSHQKLNVHNGPSIA